MPSYRARWIVPVDAPPLRDGVLTVAGERIVAVGAAPAGEKPLEFGNAVLLPGLVNAHTHLEFSDREGPIGKPGIGFTDWIARVVAERRSRDSDVANVQRAPAEAILRGLIECQRWGVTTVGEITSLPSSEEPQAGARVRIVEFLELIGLAQNRNGENLAAAEQFLAAREAGLAVTRRGISPHAPYTVNLELLADICQRSAKARFPVAMHLAESREELELLQTGSGPFVDLLSALDAWEASAFSRPLRPFDYLSLLARSSRALVIHGNYLNAEEIRFLGQHSDRLSVVFCPRTHAFFGHPRYPLPDMLSAGVNVALGTDSKASNPDLQLLREMLHTTNDFPDIDPADVIRMGTIGGARALDMDHEVGSLSPGKRADFLVVRPPERAAEDPFLPVLDRQCHVERVYQSGKAVVNASGR